MNHVAYANEKVRARAREGGRCLQKVVSAAVKELSDKRERERRRVPRMQRGARGAILFFFSAAPPHKCGENVVAALARLAEIYCGVTLQQARFPREKRERRGGRKTLAYTVEWNGERVLLFCGRIPRAQRRFSSAAPLHPRPP